MARTGKVGGRTRSSRSGRNAASRAFRLGGGSASGICGRRGGGERDKIVVCLYTARAIYIYLVHIKDHQSGPGRQSNGSLRLVSVERSVAPMNDGSVLQLVDR